MKSTAFIFLCLCSLYTTAQKTDEIDKLITSFVKPDSVPGATLLIVKKGKIVKASQYGMSNVELQVPAKQQTAYELASVSKPITATAIMQLVEAGKLRLDSSIFHYLGSIVPEKFRTIKLRHILSHSSGIPSDHFIHTKLYAPSPLRYTVKDQLSDLFKMNPVASPGEKYLYSNAGFFLQAAIIEKVSGQGFQQYMRQNIFEPAGMKHTYFCNNDSLVPNRAQVYTKRKGVLVRFSLETNLQSLDANGFGGLISTASDLKQFATQLLAGKIISQSSLAQMSTITLLNNGKASGPEASSSLGLGWFVKDINGKKTICHTGHTGTALHIFPEQDLIVVFLSNLSFGISLLNDRGYPLSDIADQIAGMAVKKYGGQ